MEKCRINIAEAKKHFSDLVGRVVYKKETILLTKRRKPVARIVPLEEKTAHLADVKGWLDPDDEFFKAIERIISQRSLHTPRIFSPRM